jgi:hypothetical protein
MQMADMEVCAQRPSLLDADHPAKGSLLHADPHNGRQNCSIPSLFRSFQLSESAQISSPAARRASAERRMSAPTSVIILSYPTPAPGPRAANFVAHLRSFARPLRDRVRPGRP